MIKLITGKKGTGKTKIIIDQINEAVKSTNGNIVCIEKGDNIRRSISYKVRWCGVEQFNISGYDAFYGFLAGAAAGTEHSPVATLFLVWIGVNFIVEFVVNTALSSVLTRVVDIYEKKFKH